MFERPSPPSSPEPASNSPAAGGVASDDGELDAIIARIGHEDDDDDDDGGGEGDDAADTYDSDMHAREIRQAYFKLRPRMIHRFGGGYTDDRADHSPIHTRTEVSRSTGESNGVPHGVAQSGSGTGTGVVRGTRQDHDGAGDDDRVDEDDDDNAGDGGSGGSGASEERWNVYATDSDGQVASQRMSRWRSARLG